MFFVLCDQCGKEIPVESGDYYTVEIRWMGGLEEEVTEWQLCQNCGTKLFGTLQSDRKKVHTEKVSTDRK